MTSVVNVNIEINHARVMIPFKSNGSVNYSWSNYVIGFYTRIHSREGEDYSKIINRTDGSMWRLETYWAHCN